MKSEQVHKPALNLRCTCPRARRLVPLLRSGLSDRAVNPDPEQQPSQQVSDPLQWVVVRNDSKPHARYNHHNRQPWSL